MKRKLLRLFTAVALTISLLICGAVAAFADGEDTSEAESAEQSENVLATAYEVCIDNADKIFSALSLLFSMLAMILIKKTAIPSIKSGIHSLCNAVSKMKSEGEEARKIASEYEKRLESFESRLTTASEKSAILIEQLAKDNPKSELKQLQTVAAGQMSLLYEIFMSSSLPKYQKDAVSEKIKELKKELGEDENEE